MKRQSTVLAYWGSGTFLEVTSVAQSAPLVYIPNPSCGMNSNQAEISLLCLVKDFHPRSIRQTWSSDSGVITTGISKYPAVQGNDKKYTMSSVLKVSAADWKTNRFYYCQAGYNSNNMVEYQFETPKIQEPNITSLVPPADFISNQNAVLGCVISGFAPDNIQVSWKKGQVDQRGVLLSSQRRGDATFETISYLTVSMVNWKEGNEYTCEVLHPPSNFKKLISMKYQQGESPCQNPASTCPPCSIPPELLYHTNLNVTFRNGEKYQYKCAQQKCQIKL